MVRIALDVDSTLHDFFELIQRIVKEKYEEDIRREKQVEWEIQKLTQEQQLEVFKEAHSYQNILASEPYPGAVDVVNRWRRDHGFRVYVMTHRHNRTHHNTQAWLTRVGLEHDGLYCLDDKVSYFDRLGIDVVIDDSPQTLIDAIAAGRIASTLLHPWTANFTCVRQMVIETDWFALERELTPLMLARAAQKAEAFAYYQREGKEPEGKDVHPLRRLFSSVS